MSGSLAGENLEFEFLACRIDIEVWISKMVLALSMHHNNADYNATTGSHLCQKWGATECATEIL